MTLLLLLLFAVFTDVVIYRQSGDTCSLDDDKNFELATGDFVVIFINLKNPLFSWRFFEVLCSV